MADARPGPVEALPPRSSAPKKQRSRGRRVASAIAKVLGALILLGGVALTAFVVIGYQTTELPDPNAEFATETTFVYYNDDKTALGDFSIQNRQHLTYAEMPENIKDAMIAAENRSFWTDRGISPRGMIRSAWVIARGGELQGGSTITQQYIKIMYLQSDRTFTRKFKELFLAYKINKQLSKEQILERYLNTIYFGRGAYGIQAASQAYFNKDAAKLNAPQAAVLASVVNNPSAFDPGLDEDNRLRLFGRYRYVIAGMQESGAISSEQAVKYATKLPKFPEIPTSQRFGGPKGFLLKMVERELTQVGFTSRQISGGGLRIVTTFDKDDQDAAVSSAQKYTSQAASAAGRPAKNLHAAIASVEVGSGEVLAIYGGPDFVKNSRNWATTPRPTASTFKTYAVAAGLENGYGLSSIFTGNSFVPPGERTPVRNEFSNQYGPVTLLRATSESINTAFVDMVTRMDNGPDKVLDMAEEVGAPRGAGWDVGSRVPLGIAEVSPLDQAAAYATFGNNGVYVAPHVVKEVLDADGAVIYKANPEKRRAVSADIARDVTYALQDVVEQGTGRTVQTLDRPVAGKTGTKDVEDDIVSAWFVAYTKQMSTAVMYVAGDSGNADLDSYRRPGDSTFFGGTYPALTWADFMAQATVGQDVERFDPPAFVNGGRPVAPSPTPTPTPSVSGSPSPSPSATPSPKNEDKNEDEERGER